MTILAAAQSMEWVSGRSLAGNVGSNLAGGVDVCLVTDACCQVEASDHEGLIIRRSWVTRGCRGIEQ